ncbi:NDP-hexose 2,3-dehydratase [Streptomyces sp. Ru73]|uniref:NDP-hexose 2,3-dehydratase family protein n=1 Tax=Streptomyces sp. Ru73 TaxID=2080748 RepID=UPI000CDE5365|nr:NDP-hexose 2,3-dehydratase family protein [Streptomyces sp. Ru73]POX42894.1 NDP-hexose 2,3-dehydratase [Streptomyces sp. Ru73]
MPTTSTLSARQDVGLPARLARSAATGGTGCRMSLTDFTGWLTHRTTVNRFRVERIPFADMDAWSFHPETGNLVHDTGRFFSVEGLHVTVGEGPFPEWQQPIINQPEIGILGILAKEFDGVLHFLMQAKMEPGNTNLVQLSPTVQATRSNYTKAHKGADVKYLQYFTGAADATVLVDVLQSEHGAWFYRKFNRNVVVETTQDVAVDDDFCWLTLGQIGELLRRDDVVNMDSRTVLACLPVPFEEPGALHSDAELLSWYAAERSRHSVDVRRIPLAGVTGWRRGTDSMDHDLGWYFRVVAVRVQASNREVGAWTQPLFEPRDSGVIAFLTRKIGGVPHLLAHARVEAGFIDSIELAPTVQYTPRHYAHLTGDARPPFLDMVLAARPDRIRYEAVHSEEGGRFLNAQARYLIVEADETEAPDEPPPGYRWLTAGQLNTLLRYGRYVNVQARTLMALLNSHAAEL